MRNIFIISLAISFCVMATERQGEHYYDFKIETKPSSQKQNSNTAPTSTQTMQKLQTLHTEALNKSILSPTHDNILQERLLAIMFMNMAEKYQKNAQIVVNHTPSINYALTHPVDHAARKQHDILVDAKRDEKIANLAKTYGLFVFYAGNCPHSRAFAPTIKRFSARYGFEMLAITTDGATLADFESSVSDKGQFATLGVKHVPAVFAVNPKNQKDMVLVGYGNLSVLELANNLYAHIQFKEKQQ